MKVNIILAFVVLLLLSLVLSSCYSSRKAKGEFAKAVTAYPEIGATFCAITYPAKDSIIKGDSVVTFDTLWGQGVDRYDTIYSRSKDTVYITKYIQGNTIREVVRLTDTVVRVDMAALTSCRLEQGKIVDLLTDKTAESDKFKEGRNKWRKIAIGLMAAMALGLFVAIRRKIVKRVV